MIYFLGDVHGHFDHILPAIQNDQGDGKGKAVVFLGDLEAQRPFEDEIEPLKAAGIEVWFIHGNHDTDSEVAWDNLRGSWDHNLDNRVVEILGLRVAGLGGVFRARIWDGQTRRYPSQTEYLRTCGKGNLWRGGLPLTHRSSIWPDVYDHLASLKADILVTHEAPSCHPHGFAAIDRLARDMGVQTAFHGHQHDNRNYRGFDTQMGFRAYSVGFCGITDLHGGIVALGDFDTHNVE